jgi:uncharacterized membrane protein (UPF0127 family)
VIKELGDQLDSAYAVRRIAWAVWIVLLLSLGTYCVKGADRPKDPRLSGAAVAPVGRIPGFGEVAFRVNGGPPLCAASAEAPEQRQRGLMGRQDLAGYDAMVFRFPADVTTTFFMRNTPLPLSIAWFDASGRLVSQTDMDPCPDIDGCPDYAPAGPYRDALEVPRGHLSTLGITTGATITIGGACA